MFLRLFFILFVFISSVSSDALTKIDITRSNISAVPIAIQTFMSDPSGGDYYKDSISNLISSDLESSGLFRVINPESYIEQGTELENKPNFISWRQIKSNVLLLIDIQHINENIASTLKLWDVHAEKLLLSIKLHTPAKNWRRIAHKISDETYKRLTGEEGYFDTKIVYVSTKDQRKNKIRRLAIMDQDGANHRFLTNGDSIVLTPRLSQDSNSLLYLSYENPLRPTVKVFDLRTNKSTFLREFNGMSYASRYTPDGKSILLSIEKRGTSNIYLYDLHSSEMTQLTFCSSICTSPSASPNQRKIAFNSDMGGGKNLYTMNFSGKNIQRITFNNGHYTNPVWSPKGDLLAFTKILPNEGFFIGIMKPDGSGEKIISHGRLVEGPSWAPNGKALVFEKQIMGDNGNLYTKLYKIDIISRKEQEIQTPYDATDAYWSNLIE